jgi:hypothetical protein
MTAADLSAWGWRIPFLFGVLVGPAGIYIRNHLEDATPPPSAKHESVVGKVFREQKLRVVLAIGALAVSTAVNYLVIYMPTYVVKTLNLPPTVGYVATLAAAIAVTVLTPIAGTISDRIGRVRHMMAVGLVLLFRAARGVDVRTISAGDARHRVRVKLQHRCHRVRRHGAGDHDLDGELCPVRRSRAGILPDGDRGLKPVCAGYDPQDRGGFVYRVIFLTMRPGRAAHHRRDAI